MAFALTRTAPWGTTSVFIGSGSVLLIVSFLPPFAPRELPRFLTTTGALSPSGRLFGPLAAMNSVLFPDRDPWFTSLRLPAIPYPTTRYTSAVTLTVLRNAAAGLPVPSGTGFRFLASPFSRRLAHVSGRIGFIIVLIMDWQFASSCSPPRLSATQLLSATKGQLPSTGTFTRLLERARGRTGSGIPCTMGNQLRV